MATLGQANKGHWIGVSTAEETGAKFFDGKGKCSWSAMLRCRQKFAKRLVGQPWREFVKGESTLLDGVDTEAEHSKQSFGQLYRAIFKGDVRAQQTNHYMNKKRTVPQPDGTEEVTRFTKFTEVGAMAVQTRIASIRMGLKQGTQNHCTDRRSFHEMSWAGYFRMTMEGSHWLSISIDSIGH